jgi:hypothetical protein
VRLRDVESGQVLVEVPSPRTDTAQRVVWMLGEHEGREVYLEAADGNEGEAFAWLAIGRIEPASIAFPERMPRDSAANLTGAFELVRDQRFESYSGHAESCALNTALPVDVRSAALLAARVLPGSGKELTDGNRRHCEWWPPTPWRVQTGKVP